MKKIFIKFFDKIIILLLGFSGMFYSCAKYGMVVAEYMLEGVVTDKETAKPIENIRIVRNNYDTLYTNSQGQYIFLFHESKKAHLQITDIDYEENGGYFADKNIYVEFPEIDKINKKHRNSESVKTLNIKLEKQEYVPAYGMPSTNFKP